MMCQCTDPTCRPKNIYTHIYSDGLREKNINAYIILIISKFARMAPASDWSFIGYNCIRINTWDLALYLSGHSYYIALSNKALNLDIDVLLIARGAQKPEVM